MASTQEMLERLTDRLGEMLDRLAALETRLNIQCPLAAERIKSAEIILHGPEGNGTRPGLLTRMALAETQQAQQTALLHDLDIPRIERTMESYRRARDWFWRGVVGLACSVAGAAVSVVVQLALGE